MQLDWIMENIADLANLEQRPTMEGRTMSLIIAPKPQVIHKLQSGKAGQKDAPKGSTKSSVPAGTPDLATIHRDDDEDFDADAAAEAGFDDDDDDDDGDGEDDSQEDE